VQYSDKNGNSAKGELSDKSDLKMEFSDTSVCDRTAYNTIQFKTNAPNGTILTVMLNCNGESQTFRFIIAATLDATVGADGVLGNPSDPAVLVNAARMLPSGYVPSGMTQPNIQVKSGVSDVGKYLCNDAAIAAEKLFTAAKNEGVILTAIKGYSDYSASDPEHQTGLALDVSSISVNYSTSSSFANSAQGQWLAQNAHLYGFILRYPSGKEGITGYAFSPSHLRYVGVQLATYLYENNLTLEELYAR
jgi:LAS superfamily LD-carboxypeptidase LdcB